jgi:hypothetical protein
MTSDGALKPISELRDQAVTRVIGMSSHTNGVVMATGCCGFLLLR